MGLFTGFKAEKAYRLHGKGEIAEARRLYEEVMAEGCNQPRYVLAYAVLLIRSGEYAKAKELLVANQKAPGITPEQKVQLFMNYAACCYKLGDIDKGISILERQHAKKETGMVYQTLGYLYVEKYAADKTPDFDAIEAQEAAAAAAQTEAQEIPAEEMTAPAPAGEKLSPREAWAAAVEKGLAFCQAAIEYDDEDAICLDNMGQYYYRVLGDKAAALPWFQKAIEVKDSQIDTLWFLSRYDLEKGDKAAAAEKLEKALEGRFSPLNFATREKIEAELAALK